LIRVTCGSQAFVIASLDEPTAECRDAMLRAYQAGTPPTIVAVDTTHDVNGVIDVVPVDPIATKKAEVVALLRDIGARDVRVTGVTYADQSTYSRDKLDRKRAARETQPLADAAHALVSTIEAEHRTDVALSAGELAASLTVNGKIHVNGKALTEQAIRGLSARLDSPMLGFILGVRDRMCEVNGKAHRARAAGDEVAALAYLAQSRADRETIAETIVRECRRAPDTALVMRTRNGGNNDVFAVVSPSYVPADAPSIVPGLLDGLPSDATGSWRYDAASTSWELRANVWTPNDTETLCVGEPFSAYASLRGRDNGTGRVGGAGGIEMLSCLNSMVYMQELARASRVHRGRVHVGMSAMVKAAQSSIGILCRAWGKARESVIVMSEKERLEGDTFLAGLFTQAIKRDMPGILVGRTSDHATALVKAYHQERRDPVQLVRSDMAQAWTRYIQTQPGAIRQDAEQAVGSWIVEGAR
jgi:hypothetical protein